MSEIYHTEPATSGKVLLKTSYGDVDVELWSKEAPLACRNFVQLAMEGYYDNCPIHRVIKDFMMQSGDPSGTGTGGESIYGKEFKDEVHGRIKFNHRGQVAMANTAGRPNSNGSQFFITLGEASWLHKKHTIFGKVTGNTVFNLMRVNDVEVSENDRPVEDICIKSVEVIWNPFDDIVPRVTKVASTDSVADRRKAKKAARKATKDSKLLSFGGDDDDGDGDGSGDEGGKAGTKAGAKAKRMGMQSAHDSKFASKQLSSQEGFIPTLAAGNSNSSSSSSSTGARQPSSAPAPASAPSSAAAGVPQAVTATGAGADGSIVAFEARMRAVMSERLAASGGASGAVAYAPPVPPAAIIKAKATTKTVTKLVLGKKTKPTAAATSADGDGDGDGGGDGRDDEREGSAQKKKKKKKWGSKSDRGSQLEARQAMYKKRKDDIGEREAATLAKLHAFTQGLKQQGTGAGAGV